MRNEIDGKDLLLSRIERLEKQNLRWKRGGLVCLLGVTAIGLMGQTQHKTTHAPAPAAAPAFVMPKNIEAVKFYSEGHCGTGARRTVDGRNGPEPQTARSRRIRVGYTVAQ